MDEKITVVTQSRWKSWPFWTTVIVGLVGLLTTVGFWDWVGVSVDYVENIVGAVLTFGALFFGNYNNSTNPVGIGANKAVKK